MAVQVGNQIVVAGQVAENGIDRVVTRISTNGGTSFAPLDDYQYVAGWSLARDIEILLATLPAVISGRGAY